MRKQQKILNVKKLLIFVLTFMLVMLEVNLQPIKVEAASYPSILLQVPYYPQKSSGDCGISSISMIEAYSMQYGVSDFDSVYAAVLAANNNSFKINEACSNGKYVDITQSPESYYAELAAGRPILIRREPYEHWSVIVGYNGSSTSLEESGFIVWDTKSGVSACNYNEITTGRRFDLSRWLKAPNWNGSAYVDRGQTSIVKAKVRGTGILAGSADTTPPVISNVQITDVTNTGYTVTCEVTDNVGVARVCFPTWTETNGQDDSDPDWYTNAAVYLPSNGNTYSFRVNISEHNNEGGAYTTHIYAYDAAGNWSTGGIGTTVDIIAPTITNVKITDSTNTGYTVACEVTDDVGVARVCFPTWTDANGQDDSDLDWYKNAAVYSPDSGNTYSFRVNIADHNNEGGTYITHIYAYDASGNWSTGGIGTTVDITAPTITNVKITDSTNIGYTVTCEVTDDVGVARVCFPTWTDANGQDDSDPDWYTNAAVYLPESGNTYSFRVNISDHNNEGGAYITHIYAYDLAGNWSVGGIGTLVNLDIPIQSITLTHSTLTIPITQPHQLSVATYTPADTTVDKTVTWSSTNEAVATVQADGTVVGNKAGRTTITAEVAGKTASCIVTVIPNDGSQVYEDFLYKVKDGKATITGYIGNATQINIPQTINGYNVTTIGNHAFDECGSLTGIKISEGITSIGAYAFMGCKNLKTLEIPKGVTSIGEFAFLDCDNLTELIYHGTETQWKDIIGGNDIGISKDEIQYVEVACPHTSTKKTITKATISQDGKVVTKCTACNEITNTETIYKASTVKLSATSYTYNGKARKPTVTVKDSNGKKLKSGTDYTVSYASGRKNVGKYNVKIKFQGNYTGTKTLSFTIIPKQTSISKLTATKKGFEVKWKKQSSQTTGYQIQYSTKKNFKGSTTKNVTVNKNKTVTKSISKLSANKKYYVRIRTYKTLKVNGKSTKIYSDWSKAKTVKTKK